MVLYPYILWFDRRAINKINKIFFSVYEICVYFVYRFTNFVYFPVYFPPMNILIII